MHESEKIVTQNPRLSCFQCGANWTSKRTRPNDGDDRPKNCPRCGSAHWGNPLTWTIFTCVQCGGNWKSKKSVPTHCAKCQSPSWNDTSKTRKTEVSGRCRFGAALSEFERLFAIETDECVEWPYAKTKNGYGAIEIDRELLSTHTLSFKKSGRVLPDGLVVRHSCDNPPCMNQRHLLPGTHKQNQEDCNERGRRPLGSLHHNAKLTEQDVIAIRSRSSMGESSNSIGVAFSLPTSSVRSIVRRRSWRHI